MEQRLKDLRAKRNDFKGFEQIKKEIAKNPTFKMEVRALYLHYFYRDVSGCGNCLADAFIELCTYKPKEMNFLLKAGVMLRDPSGDVSKNLTNHNMTDELALFHLNRDKGLKSKFQKMPTNINKLLKDENIENKKGKKKVRKGKVGKSKDNRVGE